MKRRRNRQLAAQRFALGVLGAIITAVAVVGLMITSGTVDRLTTWIQGSEPLLNASLDGTLESNTVWFQVSALAVGAFMVLLGVLWLKRQIPPMRHQQSHHFPNTSDRIDGTNTVGGSALASALADDLEQHPAIKRAVVEVRSDDDLVRLQISSDDTFALSELRDSVIAPAVERVSTVGEFGHALTAETDVRFVETERAVA